MLNRFRQIFIVTALFAACGDPPVNDDDAGNDDTDAGNVSDAGNNEVDAGNNEVDAGNVEVDAGNVEVDAGNVEVDAGNVEPDAGVNDDDGDGALNADDCAPENAAVFPGATEICNGIDDDCNESIDELPDQDGDSFGPCDVRPDCDDRDATISPGATEVCNDIDDDCSGTIDDIVDGDGDGALACGATPDCNDNDAAIFPTANELCNQIDDNCNATVDEGFDNDGDGQDVCDGDCDDGDATIFVGGTETEDGKDNDCNGAIDDPFIDDDGDGFTPAQGDCHDDFPFIGPSAIEIIGNFVDDNCNGTIDEAPVSCDGGALNNGVAADYAKALGLCDSSVVGAQFLGFAGPLGSNARAIASQFGSASGALNQPSEGGKIVLLSTGRAVSSSHDSGAAFDGSNGGACLTENHPAPLGDPGACGAADPLQVCDLAEVRFTLRVPQNASHLSFSYQFFSSEYPSFRCTTFDDTFLALLTSSASTNVNIAVDANGRATSINAAMDICLDDLVGTPRDIDGNGSITGGETAPSTNDCSIEDGTSLAGTGFIFDNDATNNGAPDAAGSQSLGAAATLVREATAQVTPGETITLRFIIFDEGDDQLDSTVLLDNFRWSL